MVAAWDREIEHEDPIVTSDRLDGIVAHRIGTVE